MNGSSLIFIIMPVMTPIALLTCIALPLITDHRSGRSHVPEEYLYVPCVHTSSVITRPGRAAGSKRCRSSRRRRSGSITPARPGTAAGLSSALGCISREKSETDGVIPIPGDRRPPGPAGGLFFATPEAAQAELHRTDCGRAEPAGRGAPRIKELRRAMADAHPDRGGTAERFIQARRRCEAALRPARR